VTAVRVQTRACAARFCDRAETFTDWRFACPQVRVMEERLQAEWSTHLPDQAEKEQAISKLATQVEEQVRAYDTYIYYTFGRRPRNPRVAVFVGLLTGILHKILRFKLRCPFHRLETHGMHEQILLWFRVITASAETPGRQNGGGQSGAYQGMGDQQAERSGSSEPAPQGAEPQVQPTVGVAQTAHGPAERGQDGDERLRGHVFAAYQHVVFAQGQQYRFHAVSNTLGFGPPPFRLNDIA